jgi:hypothetical protein
MKIRGVVSTAALFLLLGAAVPTFAQEGHDQDAKPAQHEEQAKPVKQEAQAKPEQREAQPKSAKQEQQAKPPRREQQAKPAKQENQAKPAQRQEQAKSIKPATQAKPVKQEGRGSTAGQPHVQRTAAEEQTQRAVPALRLSARGSGRIPDARFRSNFGRGHEFRIGNPTMVGGYSRFQYGGYWFGFVQPWPVGWYYTDDVYVDYIDGGYYLCNPSYPGAQIAISVVI